MRPFLAVAALLLGGCPAPAPEGSALFPVEAGKEVTVRWTANAPVSALWLDLDLDKARGLSGPIRVTADGEPVLAGNFSTGHKGLSRFGHRVHNWSSTPWGVSGQVWLCDLPPVAVGAEMVATLNLKADPNATVQRVVLQVREPSVL